MKTKKISTPDHWRKLEYHALSEMSEFGSSIDMESLIDHMAKNGYDKNEPVVLFEGKILDGRHKHTAACKAEVEPTFHEFVGPDPWAYIQKKLLRQHFNESQRAVIAEKIRAGMLTPQDCAPPTTGESAETLNVSPRLVQMAAAVKDSGTPALNRTVRNGLASVSDAYAVCKLTHAKQDKAVMGLQSKEYKTLAEAAGLNVNKPSKPRGKSKPKPQPSEDGLPKDVRNALADQWHLDCASRLSKMVKEAKSVFNWSVWLDPAIIDHLEAAKHCFTTAAPSKKCPDCNGQKAINKEPCQNCRMSGFMGSQL